MDSFFVGVFFPDIKFRLYGDFFHTVQSHDVKIPDGFVIFRRVSCRHNDPAIWNRMVSKGLALKELEHGRSQCFGNAVDLIDEKDAFRKTGLLHLIVNTGHDLAHGIFGHFIFFFAVLFF